MKTKMLERNHPLAHKQRTPPSYFSLALGSISLSLISCAMVGSMMPLPSTLISEATATNFENWSLALIAKPTYTPDPTPVNGPTATLALINTPVAALTPTNASPSIAMKLVQDTAVPISKPKAIPSGPAKPAPVSSGQKYVLVSISQQHLYAYSNGQLIYSFVASTGANNSTRVGTFNVLDKIPNAYGANWNFWMPDWLGIYWVGDLENGIHAVPLLPDGERLWSNELGSPVSYGCVVLGVNAAAWLYSWVQVGTTIQIRQ
jgi:lipoprotein-anchoring transpeptidase ErfK/SrfK